MPVPQVHHPALRAGIIAGVALVTWGWIAPAASMPPVSPVGDQPAYLVSDDARVALVEPVLRAPWTQASVVMRTMAPVFVIGAAAVAAQAAGAGGLATLAAVLAVVLDASFAATVGHAGRLALAAGFIWVLAATLGGRWPSRGGAAGMVVAGLAAWVGAVSSHWLALCAWPLAVAAVWQASSMRARSAGVMLVAALGMLAAWGYFSSVSAMAAAMSWAPGVTLGWRDALAVAFDTRPRVPPLAFIEPDMVGRASYLGIVLAVVGLLTGVFARGTRRAGVAVAATAGIVVMLWPEWQAEVVRLARWLVLPLASLGLTWAARQVQEPWRARAVASVLGVILVGDTWVVGARPLGGAEPRTFRDQFVEALHARESAGPAVLVAEDTRMDSALASWIDGDVWHRTAQDGALIRAALESGRQVLAGPVARRQLELSGVTFSEGFLLTAPIPYVVSAVDTLYRCVAVLDDHWSPLSGVDYTGRLGVMVPPGISGEVRLVVGDELPLRLRAATADRRELPLEPVPLTPGPGASAPPADFWLNGSLPGEGPREVAEIRLPAHPTRGTLVSVHLGRRAPQVIARLEGYDGDARGRVCAAPAGAVVDTDANLLEEEERFGVGWYGYEGRDADRFRWASADAVLLVRAPRREAVTVELEAAPAVVDPASAADGARLSGTDIELRVNGVVVGARGMRAGRSTYTWDVPAGTWLAGTNELWWNVSREVRPADSGGADTRWLAMRVAAVRVRQ